MRLLAGVHELSTHVTHVFALILTCVQFVFVLDFERLIQNVDSLLQAFREVFQLQTTKDDPLSIAMK
jgi:hypothetical protein